MKKKLFLLPIIISCFFSEIHAQRTKVMEAHPDIIQMLAEIKQSAENTAGIIKSWDSAKGIAEGKKKYEVIQKLEAGFTARYKVIIQTPKILKKTGENVKNGLNAVVEENNKFLKFCDDNNERYAPKNNAAGVGDVVEGVAAVVLKLLEFYNKATQGQKDQFKKDVDEQILKPWKDVK